MDHLLYRSKALPPCNMSSVGATGHAPKVHFAAQAVKYIDEGGLDMDAMRAGTLRLPTTDCLFQ